MVTAKLPPVDKPVEITGSKADDPERPPVRREIREMKNNYPKEWALFLLGLEKFQAVDEKHPLSWFQIAGIHGMPYTSWPAEDWAGGWNKGKIKKADTAGASGQWDGFCTHSSVLFLPWHRPYLALFESELRRHVQAAAEEYTEDEGRDEYLKAAATFRLPYWDWALPSDLYENVFPSEAVPGYSHDDVIFPQNRKTRQFDYNPLAGYRFKDIGKNNGDINKFPKVNATLRYPKSDKKNSDTEKQDEELRKRFIFQFKPDEKTIPRRDAENPIYTKGKNLTERVRFLLQAYDSFGPISSNNFRRDEEQGFANWGSLEDVHNALHGLTGGGGHMSSVAIAAFDPIFWLHHCNIDRLYAIWQALWDKGEEAQYVRTEYTKPKKTESSRHGTFTNAWDGKDTIDTKLTPFTKDTEGNMWTSRGVRATTTFGYVYPETQSWLYPTKEDIYQQLDHIYPDASLAASIKASKDKAFKARAGALLAFEAATELDTAGLLQAQLALPDSADAQKLLVEAAETVKLPAKRSLDELVIDNKYFEWLVDIRAEKHSLGGDFIVHVFLGPPDDSNASLYIADPNHVAIFSTFGSDEQTGCVNCQRGQEARLEVTGQIPLTLALVERYLAGKLDGLTSDHVIPFLQTDLHWRVTDNSGVRTSREAVDRLLVSVVSNEVTIPDEPSALPSYAPTVEPWPAATTNKDGGARGRGTGLTETSAIV